MKKRKRRFFKLLSVFLVLFFIISIITVVFFDRTLSYQLEVYSSKIAANMINSSISKSIIEEIDKSEMSYESLIKIEKDTEGKVTCISADMMKVNLLKNRLDIAVSAFCSDNTYYEAKIPIGSLMNNSFLHAKGFDLSIKFKPIGKTATNMSGVFVESGINQTIYRISFDVDVDAAVVFPFRYIEIPIKVETVIAETVIVGDVPQSFTHFDLNGDITSQDFQGYVEDYMAE